jgi:2,3-bisphosphoglycerate-independent phosphoglycerate mutase
MKRVMVIIDGLGDEPIAELDGRTPIEAALAPNIHFIASRGEIGCIATTFEGFPIESMVCIMGLLGYPPQQFYPSGRAAFEAMAKGIPLHPDDLVLRCNTVTVDRKEQRLTDFTGGQISDSAARKLVSNIQLPAPTWELYPGQSYRNILIVRKAGMKPKMLKCREPHMNIGGLVEDLLPQGDEGSALDLAAQLRVFLLDSQRQIAASEQEDGCAANMLWVWSPSSKVSWPTFAQRTGWKGAVVGGLDFLHGIAMAANIHWDVVPGATGYIDTDYTAKARYAIGYLNKHDFVLVHVNAADEEAHLRNWRGKIEAIEKTDRMIVGPLLHELNEKYRGDYKIVVCGDHTTRCSDGKHTDDLVPYAVFPAKMPCHTPLSESTSRAIAPISSLNFLSQVLY